MAVGQFSWNPQLVDVRREARPRARWEDKTTHAEVLVILLTGGTKRRQQRDIEQAKAMWLDYKRRRRPPAR